MLGAEVAIAETAVADNGLEFAFAGVGRGSLVFAGWFLGHAAADR